MSGKQQNTNMTSSRPYLVRALHEWIVDNNVTPYILVNAMHPDARVPNEYVEGGKIVLNISPNAVNALVLEKSHIEFEARFRGVVEYIYVPMAAVMAIYAKENGRGMAFDDSEDFARDETSASSATTSSTIPAQSDSISKSKSKPKKIKHLKIIK